MLSRHKQETDPPTHPPPQERRSLQFCQQRVFGFSIHDTLGSSLAWYCIALFCSDQAHSLDSGTSRNRPLLEPVHVGFNEPCSAPAPTHVRLPARLHVLAKESIPSNAPSVPIAASSEEVKQPTTYHIRTSLIGGFDWRFAELTPWLVLVEGTVGTADCPHCPNRALAQPPNPQTPKSPNPKTPKPPTSQPSNPLALAPQTLHLNPKSPDLGHRVVPVLVRLAPCELQVLRQRHLLALAGVVPHADDSETWGLLSRVKGLQLTLNHAVVKGSNRVGVFFQF